MRQLKISWSSLQNFEKCQVMGAKQLSRVKAPPQNVRHFFHGTVADSVMRAWLKSGAVPGTMPDLVDEILDREEQKVKDSQSSKLVWKSRDDKGEVRDYVKRLSVGLEPFLLEKVVPYTFESGKWLRVPFKIKSTNGFEPLEEAAEVTLIGETDLFVTREDGYYCEYDLKATQDKYYWKKCLGQHFFYALMIYGLHGVLPREVGFIQPMCEQPYIPVDVTKDNVAELMQRVIRMANILYRDEAKFPEDMTHCNEWSCKYRPNCERFDLSAFGGTTI